MQPSDEGSAAYLEGDGPCRDGLCQEDETLPCDDESTAVLDLIRHIRVYALGYTHTHAHTQHCA